MSIGSGRVGSSVRSPSAATNRSNCAGVVTWSTRAVSERIWNVCGRPRGSHTVAPVVYTPFGVAAREPHLAVDHVEQLVLDVVAVQWWSEVPRTDELHDGHGPVRLFRGHLGGEQVVEEVEVLALVTGDQDR